MPLDEATRAFFNTNVNSDKPQNSVFSDFSLILFS